MSPKKIIDSQLLIALFNPKDAFHEKAKEIIADNVIFLESVRKEAKMTFLRKYNYACIKIYHLIDAIRLGNFKTEEEILKFAEMKLREIISSEPKLENFYRFVFDLIKDKLVDRDKLINIPSFLDDYATKIAAKMNRLGEKQIIIKIDEDKLKLREEIYRIIKNIKFRLRDMEIFCDAVAYTLDTGEECEFCTGDEKFYKRALEALERLRQYGCNPKLKITFVTP